jgi:hypothetical protein
MEMRKYDIIAVFILLLLTACNTDSFFKLDRPEVTPWNNVNDFEYMVVSPYTAQFQLPEWQSPLGITSFYGELVADLTFVNPWTVEQETPYWYSRHISSFDVTGEKTEESFKVMYGAIGTCNVPLSFIEGKENAGEPVFADMSDKDKQVLARQKGELYFMRAYSYWLVSRIFMPPYNEQNASKRFIPLVTDINPTQEALRNPYMGTVAEVYDLMVSDLKKAQKLLPETNTRGRANKYAAATLLMRVYWLMGKDAEALDECNFIIQDGVEKNNYYDLSEEPIHAFNRNTEAIYTTNPVAKESIWDAAFTSDGVYEPAPLCRMCKAGGKVYNSEIASYSPDDINWTGGLKGVNYKHGPWACAYWNPNIIKYIGWATTNNPLDTINYVPSTEALKDKRFVQLHAFLKGYNGNDSVSEEEYEQTFKKLTWNVFWCDKYFRAPYGRYSNIPLMRLPEIYLTRASLLLASNPEQALEDVNVVRKRAGLSPLATLTETDIEKERIKELGFEGSDRLLYLEVMKKPIDGVKKSLGSIDLQSSTNDPMSGTDIPAITYPYSDMYVPLPSIETLYSNSSATTE